VLHGVTGRLAFRALLPPRTTRAEGYWSRSPHLWLGLEGAQRTADQVREGLLRGIKEVHGECRVCARLVPQGASGRADREARGI
jgi:hypothetical protein